MQSTIERRARATAGGLIGALIGVVAMTAWTGTAGAQTYGFATLQPGTLNHTTASAVAKVLKEKAGHERAGAADRRRPGDRPDGRPAARPRSASPTRWRCTMALRRASRICASSPRRMRCASASSCARTAACGRSPTSKASECRMDFPPCARSSRRCAPSWRRPVSTEKDIKPVLVPNVIRSADDFTSGAADAFYFAFGAPKVREVDATVGGIRMTEIDEKGMAAARKIERWGYLTEVGPGPVFIGVEKPMKVYSFDNLLFTSAKMPATSWSTRSSTRWRRTRTTWSRCSRCCANSRRRSATSSTTCRTIRAP